MWIERGFFLVLLGFVLIWGWGFYRSVQRHRGLMKRMDQYTAWLKTLDFATMSAEEKAEVHRHIERVLRDGPEGGYHGPWENVDA